MNPNEWLYNIRTSNDLSRNEFADRFNRLGNVKITPRIIENCELDKQKIPDEFALVLEKVYNKPFKWIRTGQGKDYFKYNDNNLIQRDVSGEIEHYGERFPLIAVKYGLSEHQMAEKLKISLREYQEIISTSPYPLKKQILNNFINTFPEDLNFLFYNITPDEEAPSKFERIEIYDSNSDSGDTLTSNEVREIKNILKILKSQSVDLLKDKVFLSSNDD